MAEENKEPKLFKLSDKGTTEAYGNMASVIGRPHWYLRNADPGGRTFTRHMLPSAPIVMLRPGRVKFVSSEDVLDEVAKSLGYKASDGGKAGAQLVEKVKATREGWFGSGEAGKYGVTADDERAIQEAINKKQKGTVYDYDSNTSAMRHFEFQPRYDEYRSVFATLSSRLFSRMSNKAAGWFGMDYGTKSMEKGGFYSFWATNATSVSESQGNEVGPTALEGIVKGAASISRQLGFFMEDNFVERKFGAGGERSDSAINSLMQQVSGAIGGEDMRGIRASLGDAILGMNPMFPHIWKDSRFDRSYNLSFKFHSPYGHPGAVFQNVLMPFAHLLALVLPVLRSPTTYSEPFIFQLDCPGYFACDLGICTGFSFIKGGSDNLWTVDGLPRQIDVNMQVQDLYPTLAASNNNKSLYFNIGLGTFLDNLAGITMYSSNYGEGDVVQNLRRNINSALTQGLMIPSEAKAKIQDFSRNLGGNAFLNAINAFRK